MLGKSGEMAYRVTPISRIPDDGLGDCSVSLWPLTAL